MENNRGKLIVKYNNRIVGYLVLLNDEISFQYDNDWIKNGFSISPLSLPLSNKIYINNKNNFDGLYGVFNDSLPDGWGELLTRRMLATKNIDYDKLNPLQKLALCSDISLGGLQYYPSNNVFSNVKCDDIDDLARQAKEIYDNEVSDNLDQIYYLGGSSGGARPKAHIKYNNEDWIVKFPCGIDPKNIGKLEYDANELSKLCGIRTNEYKLFDSKICNGYFGCKRFDRINGKRLHVISLCAMLETSHRIPNLDYGHLFAVINKYCDNEEMYEAFKRMCFNVFYQNKDDHGKNISFIYNENKKCYELSPSYDITKTVNKLEHEMTINANPNPNEEDILFIANSYNLDINRCKKIIKDIKEKCK